MRNLISTILIIITMSLICLGCNGRGSNPTAPSTGQPPVKLGTDGLTGSHSLLGLWTLTFDENDLSVDIHPNREAFQHYNITPMITPPNCIDCIDIQVESYDPATRILVVRVWITNPTQLEARDVRGIIMTDDSGKELLNPYGWTGYWDAPGGEDINPFVAYFTHYNMHKFPADTQGSEYFEIYMANWNPINFAVDASFPGNCGEPYRIENFKQYTIDPAGTWEVFVEVFNWAGIISPVWFDIPEVAGSIEMDYTGETTMYGSLIFRGEFSNTMGASPGEYEGRIRAYSDDPEPLWQPVTFYLSDNDPSQEGWAISWEDGYVKEDHDFSVITEIVVDDNGDILVTGSSSLMFPNMPTVKKIGSDGQEIWSVSMEWPFDQWENGSRGDGIAVDSDGNVYASGWFSETLDFMPGPGEELHEAQGRQDAYLVKYSTNGDYLWGHSWGGELVGQFIDMGYAVDVDSAGDVYVAGLFYGTCDFDPGPGEEIRVSNGSPMGLYDSYLVKFDPEGNFQWVNTWGSDNPSGGGVLHIGDSAFGLVIDSLDDVYVTGGFTDTCDFDPSGGVEERTATGPSGDVYLVKFDSSGSLVWVTSWEASGAGYTYGMYRNGGKYLVADSMDNVYVHGSFEGSVDFDPGSGVDFHQGPGMFISSFDSSGQFRMAETWLSIGEFGIVSTGVSVTGNGEILLTGSFIGEINLDPGPGQEIYTSEDTRDAFLVKLDSSGGYLWSQVWGGESDSEYDGNGGFGVTVDSDGYVYQTGWFKGTVDFNPNPLGYDVHYCGPMNDSVLIRYKPDGSW